MNKKRILAIIMSLTLAFSVVGCGNSDNGGTSSTDTTTSQDSSSTSGDGFKKIDLNEKNVFELGAKQTKEIKSILEKYGVVTAYNADDNIKAPVQISKDENDCSTEDSKGYSITTVGDVVVNDGGQHNYTITYGAYVDTSNNNEPYYLYQIDIQYPTTEEFKIDNFKMFKDLVQEVQGSDYDFSSLESWMNDHMKQTRDGSLIGGSARDVGSYHEGLEGGDTKLGNKNQYFVSYMISLRK